MSKKQNKKRERSLKVHPLRPITVEMLRKNPRLGYEKWDTFIKSDENGNEIESSKDSDWSDVSVFAAGG